MSEYHKRSCSSRSYLLYLVWTSWKWIKTAHVSWWAYIMRIIRGYLTSLPLNECNFALPDYLIIVFIVTNMTKLWDKTLHNNNGKEIPEPTTGGEGANDVEVDGGESQSRDGDDSNGSGGVPGHFSTLTGHALLTPKPHISRQSFPDKFWRD